MKYSVKTYKFDPVQMAKNLSLDELLRLMSEVRADASCQAPPDSFYIFNKKGKDRLEEIGWAIYNKTKQLNEVA